VDSLYSSFLLLINITNPAIPNPTADKIIITPIATPILNFTGSPEVRRPA